MTVGTRYIFRDMTLPELCMSLHESLWGAADPWRDEDRAEAEAYIAERLRNWGPSVLKQCKIFDEAVRLLCLTTLAECDAEREARMGRQPTP